MRKFVGFLTVVGFIGLVYIAKPTIVRTSAYPTLPAAPAFTTTVPAAYAPTAVVQETAVNVWDYWGTQVAQAVTGMGAYGWRVQAIDRQTPYGDSGWNFVTIYFRAD